MVVGVWGAGVSATGQVGGVMPVLTPPSPERSAAFDAQRRRLDALTDVLRRGLVTGPEGERASVLAGLRRLRDPALLPLFAHLSMCQGISGQLHGMLGMAELAQQSAGARGGVGGAGGSVDLLSVRQLPDATWRSIMVLEASRAGLLEADGLVEVASWRDLEPEARLEVSARAVRLGRAIEADPLRALMEHQDPAIAFGAASVLLQATGEGAAEQVLRQRAPRLASVATSDPAAVRRVITLLKAHRLNSAGPALERLHGLVRSGDQTLADEVLVAWLVCAAERQVPTQAIMARLEPTVSLPLRRAMTIQLLEAALLLQDELPQAIGERLMADTDATISTMGRAIHTISIGCGSTGEAIVALVQMTQSDPGVRVMSVGWGLRASGQRHWQDARNIRAAVLGVGLGATGGAGGEREMLGRLAADAASEIARDDPAALTEELALAVQARDARACGIILDGLLRSGRSEASEVVRGFGLEAAGTGGAGGAGVGRWPDEVTAAMAVLIAVRAEPQRAGELAERLAGLATGGGARASDQGGDLPEALRVQAAWLALRAWEEDRVALARILAEAQTAPASGR